VRNTYLSLVLLSGLLGKVSHDASSELLPTSEGTLGSGLEGGSPSESASSSAVASTSPEFDRLSVLIDSLGTGSVCGSDERSLQASTILKQARFTDFQIVLPHSPMPAQGRVRKRHRRMFHLCLTHGAFIREKDRIPFG